MSRDTTALQSKHFHMSVGLWQGCVTFLSIVYMIWIKKCSQADECATMRNCKISRLLFANDLVLFFLKIWPPARIK